MSELEPPEPPLDYPECRLNCPYAEIDLAEGETCANGHEDHAFCDCGDIAEARAERQAEADADHLAQC